MWTFSFFAKAHQMDTFNFTSSELMEAGSGLVLLLTVITLYGIVHLRHTVKRFAWYLSAINAAVMTLSGGVYLHHLWCNRFALGLPVAKEIFHDRSNFSVLVCLWFGVVNIFDLGIGFVYYPAYQGILTSWIHHLGYIHISYVCITGNGGFYAVTPYANALLLAAMEEFPTFLLALGSMYGSLRTDAGFGISFFLLRIVFHGYLCIVSILAPVEFPLLVVSVLSMSMHVYWFYTWVGKYGFKKVTNKLELHAMCH
jgi:hypothetical protein